MVAKSQKKNYSIYVNNGNLDVEPEYIEDSEDAYYAYFRLPSPMALFTEYTFRLHNDTDNAYVGDILTYSASFYVRSAIEMDTTDAKTRNLINAMTNYCLSAVAFVDAQANNG